MKTLLKTLAGCLAVSAVFADKPPVTPAVYEKWASVQTPKLSNDGNYVGYFVSNMPVDTYRWVLQATRKDWKAEFEGINSGLILPDSRWAVVLKPKEGMDIVALGGSRLEHVPQVASFKVAEQAKSNWVAYLLKDQNKTLVLRNVPGKKQQTFAGVTEYSFDTAGTQLLLQTEATQSSGILRTVQLVSVPGGSTTTLWSSVATTGNSPKVANMTFSPDGKQLAFTEEQIQGDPKKSVPVRVIWYFTAGMDKATVLVNSTLPGLEAGMSIAANNRMMFSQNGKKLFFSLMEPPAPKAKPDAVQVDVWNYKDPKLQSKQLNALNPKSSRHDPLQLAMVDIQSRNVIQLEQENDQVHHRGNGQNDDLLLVRSSRGDAGNEWNWNEAAKSSVYLLSTADGSRKLLSSGLPSRAMTSYRLTPDGKYLTYYDADQKNYFSYLVDSGATQNVTEGISATWTSYSRDDEPASPYYNIGIAAFVEGDTRVLIYEQHDIWMVDLAGKQAPVNVTNGYGRKHNILFRIAIDEYGMSVKPNARLILSAFDLGNKDDGFFSVNLGKAGDPQKLILEPFIFKGPPESNEVNQEKPVKARDAEAYVVRRMDSSTSPNYFFTTDFKTLRRLTDVHPEKNYNWMTTELMTWKSLDGRTIQGVLYKPENFDPNKKYPIIFHFYEIMSDRLHEYLRPEMSYGPMSIPHFVSNGYLVFTPDIHFTEGQPGKSSYNAVVSAAQLMAQKPWVNSKKMAIQGHSWGGFQSYYIAVHTDMFAAVVASAGMSNLVTCYGDIIGDGSSRQRQYELYRDRIGATLWNGQDLYLDNSPVLRADKLTSPILMLHNQADDDVLFGQAKEMFTATRRLGKKSWLLQYDGQGHLIFGKAGEDFQIRMTQFFDHYLKDAPPPKWMTEGVPAKLKGVETGLALDTSGKQP